MPVSPPIVVKPNQNLNILLTILDDPIDVPHYPICLTKLLNQLIHLLLLVDMELPCVGAVGHGNRQLHKVDIVPAAHLIKVVNTNLPLVHAITPQFYVFGSL